MAVGYTSVLGDITLGYFQLGEVASAATPGEGTFSSAGVGAFAALGSRIVSGSFASTGLGAALFVGADAVGSGTFASAGLGAFLGIGASVKPGVFASAGTSTALWVGFRHSIGMPDAEVTSYFTRTGIIQYRMPVGYITINQNNAGADVTPESSSNG